MPILIHPDEIPRLLEAKEKLTADIRYMPDYSKIAATIKMHPKTLSYHFRSYFGVTMYEYFITKRMEAAKKLLTQGYQVQEVAKMVGYSNINGFSKAFKKQCSISPLEYKGQGNLDK